jgi:penicillin-binding protein 1C
MLSNPSHRPTHRPIRRDTAARRNALALCFASGVALVLGLDTADKAIPPPMTKLEQRSVEVVDRSGQLLRAFANEQGRWRLATDVGDVDPKLVAMILAYEDRRFYWHRGIDPLAMTRAAWQWLRHGRIVSGGSTLTMQVARLMEPRQARSIPAKLKQMLRAVQLERRLSKKDILKAYLTLAPYGGNLEGVRAASLAYFGRAPQSLALEEAALLVALPQNPEARRPDRHPKRAYAARNRVLERLTGQGVLPAHSMARVQIRPVPHRRLALPALAAHAAHRALQEDAEATVLELPIDADVQARLEAMVQDAVQRLSAKHGPKQGLAIIAKDVRDGGMLAQIGAPDFTDARRAGWVDMSRAARSPGSTLKPFIYGLAISEGLVLPETIVSDRPEDFAGYRPKNFDSGYRGDVSVRTALQTSLNVPAIRLLDAVGPQRLMDLMERADITPRFPKGEGPGLAMGLGGVGLTLEELVTLYGRLAQSVSSDAKDGEPPLLPSGAAWHVTDILAGVAPSPGVSRAGPTSTRAGRIAYKTGTSYGHRDAWAIGFDGATVIGVWTGRADNAAIPGMTGLNAAAPILFEAFAQSGRRAVPLPQPPDGLSLLARHDLPVALQRFAGGGLPPAPKAMPEDSPAILYPVRNARIALAGSGQLPLKLQGGRPPFRWLANGQPLDRIARVRDHVWQADGPGYATLTVIDALGRSDSVSIFVEDDQP